MARLQPRAGRHRLRRGGVARHPCRRDGAARRRGERALVRPRRRPPHDGRRSPRPATTWRAAGPASPAPSSADPAPTRPGALGGFAPLWRAEPAHRSWWAGSGDHPPPARSGCRSIPLVQRGSTLLLLAFVAAAGCATRPDVVLETLTPAPEAPAVPGQPASPVLSEGAPAAAGAPADLPCLHGSAAAVVHAGRVGRHPAAHVGHQHGPAVRRGLGRDVRLRPDVRRRAARDRRGRPRHLPLRDSRRPARRGAVDLPDLRRAGRDRRGHQGRGLRPVLAGLQPLHGPRHEGDRRHPQRPRRRRPRSHRDGPQSRRVAALARRRQRRPGGPPLLHVRLQRPVVAPRRAVALEPHRAAAHHRRGPPGQGRRGRVRRAVAPLGLGGPQPRDARAAGPGRRPRPGRAPSTSSSATTPTSCSPSRR